MMVKVMNERKRITKKHIISIILREEKIFYEYPDWLDLNEHLGIFTMFTVPRFVVKTYQERRRLITYSVINSNVIFYSFFTIYV